MLSLASPKIPSSPIKIHQKLITAVGFGQLGGPSLQKEAWTGHEYAHFQQAHGLGPQTPWRFE